MLRPGSVPAFDQVEAELLLVAPALALNRPQSELQDVGEEQSNVGEALCLRPQSSIAFDRSCVTQLSWREGSEFL